MNQLNDEQILSLLNQSEFGHLGPFEFVYAKEKDAPRTPDTRHGEKCYVLRSKDGSFFYVLLDGTIKQEGFFNLKKPSSTE